VPLRPMKRIRRRAASGDRMVMIFGSQGSPSRSKGLWAHAQGRRR
jgi:hypothetical protein